MIALLLALACVTLGGAVGFATYALAAIMSALHPRATWDETRAYAFRAAFVSIGAAGLALTTAGLVISAVSRG